MTGPALSFTVLLFLVTKTTDQAVQFPYLEVIKCIATRFERTAFFQKYANLFP